MILDGMRNFLHHRLASMLGIEVVLSSISRLFSCRVQNWEAAPWSMMMQMVYRTVDVDQSRCLWGSS